MLINNRQAVFAPARTLHFYPLQRIALSALRVDSDASRTLNEPALARRCAGDLLVRENKNLLYAERVLYRVMLEPESQNDLSDPHI